MSALSVAMISDCGSSRRARSIFACASRWQMQFVARWILGSDRYPANNALEPHVQRFRGPLRRIADVERLLTRQARPFHLSAATGMETQANGVRRTFPAKLRFAARRCPQVLRTGPNIADPEPPTLM